MFTPPAMTLWTEVVTLRLDLVTQLQRSASLFLLKAEG